VNGEILPREISLRGENSRREKEGEDSLMERIHIVELRASVRKLSNRGKGEGEGGGGLRTHGNRGNPMEQSKSTVRVLQSHQDSNYPLPFRSSTGRRLTDTCTEKRG